MNYFAIELINKILDHLTLDERLDLRCVCKKWKYSIDQLKSNSNLIVTESEYYTNLNSKNWFINEDNKLNGLNQLFLSSNKLDRLLSKSSKLILNNLKRFIIYKNYNQDFSILIIKLNTILNSFKNLEYVDIYFWGNNFFGTKHYNLKLSLPKLKIFEFNCPFKTAGNIKLNCPNLFKLSLCIHKHVYSIIRYPKTIKFLKTIYYKQNFNQLINLDHLIIWDISDLIHINFSKIINLKKLNIEGVIGEPICRRLFETNDELNTNLTINILSHLLIDKNDNLKIFFRGFYLHNLESLIKYLESTKLSHEYYFEESNTNTCLYFNLPIYYDYFKANHYSIDKLIKRFKHSTTIIINNKLDNEVKLEQFINQFQYSIELEFSNCELSQNFFNRLPLLNCSIRWLSLSNQFTNSNKNNFNLEFILKLKNLIVLKLDFNIESIDFINNLFNSLKYLSYFNFKFNNQIYTIDYLFLLDNQLPSIKRNNLTKFNSENNLNQLNTFSKLTYFLYLFISFMLKLINRFYANSRQTLL